jgi:hypothetical protein
MDDERITVEVEQLTLLIRHATIRPQQSSSGGR